jgi:hypothetical protein
MTKERMQDRSLSLYFLARATILISINITVYFLYSSVK